MRQNSSKSKIEGIGLVVLISGSFFVLAVGVDKTFTDTETFQSGPAQCRLLLNPSGQEVSGCTFVITFPTPFKSIPTKYGISTQCLSNTAQVLTGKTAEQVCAGIGFQQGHSFATLTTQSIIFQSDNGETWTNMPVAKTELYGNVNHETAGSTLNVNSVTFSVNCITASTGVNAILRPEFSTPSGFFPVSLGGTGLDLSVNSFLCGSGAGGQVLNIADNVNSTIRGLIQPVIFRIVGIGGGGVGDNPVFNNIAISTAIQISNSVIPMIGNQNGNGGLVTTSTMNVWVTALQPGFGFVQPIFNWWACVC